MVLLDPWFSIGDGFTHLGELMSVDIFDCHYWVWEMLLASGWWSSGIYFDNLI